MFYVGLMTSLNGLLIVFASPTDRTPGFLQALLVNITCVPAPCVCYDHVPTLVTRGVVLVMNTYRWAAYQ